MQACGVAARTRVVRVEVRLELREHCLEPVLQSACNVRSNHSVVDCDGDAGGAALDEYDLCVVVARALPQHVLGDGEDLSVQNSAEPDCLFDRAVPA